MIQFKDLSFSYNGRNAIFKNLTWDIGDPGEGNYLHFVLGPSGHGKSTLFKLILGIIAPQRGAASAGNKARMAYVPQEPVLFEHLSIYDNATFFKNIRARKKEFDIARFGEFAKVLGLDKELLRSNKSVSQLSGGQRRKLSLLKALSLNPNILLLDEPTTGLDAQVKMELLQQLKSLAHKHGILVLYITHHFEEARLIGDKIHYLMKTANGAIDNISTQTVQEFKRSPPCLEAAYLVDFPIGRIEQGNLEGETFRPNAQGEFYKRTIDGNIQIFGKSGRLVSKNIKG